MPTSVLPASPRVRRRLARSAAVTLLAVGLALAATLPAAAHVRVAADNPTAGGFSVLTFRVPNESDTAGTTKIAVTLPNTTPFLYVSTKPVPGWSSATAEAKLPQPVDVQGTTITKAVRTVTWTADRGVQIKPGEYQEFSISVGPLPDPATVTLPTSQTYSDGTVVAWDQPTPASGEEPEHPAPTVTVVAAAATSGHDDHGSAPSSASPAAQSDSDPVARGGGSDTLARVLGGLGLVAGLAALAVALFGRRRSAA